MRESAIEAACCRYARQRGVLPVKLHFGAIGMPDRMFLLPGGRALLVEFKTPVGRLSPRQKLVHEELNALGHPVTVVRSVAVFKLWLDGIT